MTAGGVVSVAAPAGDLTGTTLKSTVVTSSLTSTGALNGGSITSGFGAIDVGSSNIDGGTITADTALVGTLSTAAQANITSVGTLTSLALSGNVTMADDTSIGISDSDERIEFDGAGDISIMGADVGIGVVAPAAKLDIRPANEAANSFRIYRGVDSGYELDYLNIAQYAGDTVFNTVNNAGDAEFIFQQSGSEQMRIDTTGNLGLGTNDPPHRLSVVGASSVFSYADATPVGTPHSGIFNDAIFGSTDTANTGITLFGTTQLGIAFGDAASSLSGQIRYQHSTNTFEFLTSDTTALTLDGSQDVNIPNGGLAIGTTSSPTMPLDVFGSLSSSTSNENVARIAAADAVNAGGITINSVYGDTAASRITSIFSIDGQGQASPLALGNGSSTALYIDEGGLVGIGTTSPTGLLSLESAGDTFLQFELTGTGANVWNIGMDNNDGAFKIIDGAAGATAAVDIDADKFQITNSTDPYLRLYSEDSGNKYANIWVDASEATLWFNAPQSSMQMAFSTVGSEAMRIDASQDVTFAGSLFIGGTDAANALDDYEEGAWTPKIDGSGGESGQSYTTQSGRYQRVGQVVHCQCVVKLSAKGTITGYARVSGLPLTPNAVPTYNVAATSIAQASISDGHLFYAQQCAGNPFCYLYESDISEDEGLTQVTTSVINDDTEIVLSLTYRTSA